MGSISGQGWAWLLGGLALQSHPRLNGPCLKGGGGERGRTVGAFPAATKKRDDCPRSHGAWFHLVLNDPRSLGSLPLHGQRRGWRGASRAQGGLNSSCPWSDHLAALTCWRMEAS